MGGFRFNGVNYVIQSIAEENPCKCRGIDLVISRQMENDILEYGSSIRTTELRKILAKYYGNTYMRSHLGKGIIYFKKTKKVQMAKKPRKAIKSRKSIKSIKSRSSKR